LADNGDEASTKPIYVIDTSALIDLWLTYPHRTFDRLWERFTALAAAGRLIAPEEVKHEISRRDENLKAWAAEADGLFRTPDDGFIACLARVVPECPYLTPLSRRYAADAWVVALALQLQESEQGKMFGAPCYVVTHEQKVTQPGKLKIPDACDHYGLRYIRMVRIFELEGWEGH
jgi:predicted nucleic acid-binding protein